MFLPDQRELIGVCLVEQDHAAHRVHNGVSKEVRDALHRVLDAGLDGREGLDVAGQAKGVELMLKGWGSSSHGLEGRGGGSKNEEAGRLGDKDLV